MAFLDSMCLQQVFPLDHMVTTNNDHVILEKNTLFFFGTKELHNHSPPHIHFSDFVWKLLPR